MALRAPAMRVTFKIDVYFLLSIFHIIYFSRFDIDFFFA